MFLSILLKLLRKLGRKLFNSTLNKYSIFENDDDARIDFPASESVYTPHVLKKHFE